MPWNRTTLRVKENSIDYKWILIFFLICRMSEINFQNSGKKSNFFVCLDCVESKGGTNQCNYLCINILGIIQSNNPEFYFYFVYFLASNNLNNHISTNKIIQQQRRNIKQIAFKLAHIHIIRIFYLNRWRIVWVGYYHHLLSIFHFKIDYVI